MNIWDGNEFSQVSDKEGKALIKADKAQDIEDCLAKGIDYKYRAEFTGYKTREMRAATNPPKAVKKVVKKVAAKKPKPKAKK